MSDTKKRGRGRPPKAAQLGEIFELIYILQVNCYYRVFQLDMLHFKRLLGHQKSTFKS